MGATSGRKAYSIVTNTQNVLAIEAMAAGQGIDLREQNPAAGTGAALEVIRAVSPKLTHDRSLSDEIEAVRAQIGSGAVIEAAAGACGGLG
jgi:histidine ammonia-lyase